MLDAERQKSNTPQAEVLRFRTQNLQISHNWTGLMKRLLSYKLAATALWRYLDPPQVTRDENTSFARVGVDAYGGTSA